jgi:hypothetical protein
LFDVFDTKRRTRRRPSLLYGGNNDGDARRASPMPPAPIHAVIA